MWGEIERQSYMTDAIYEPFYFVEELDKFWKILFSLTGYCDCDCEEPWSVKLSLIEFEIEKKVKFHWLFQILFLCFHAGDGREAIFTT